MEAVGGQRPPRWYIWENLDGKGGAWKEHAILDVNLGGHEAVVGDVTGNGKPDVDIQTVAGAARQRSRGKDLCGLPGEHLAVNPAAMSARCQ